MSIKTLNKLRQRAFELDEEARADLAYDLLETISGPVEEANEKWLEEAGRRLADFDAGRTDAAPVEEILKEIDKQLL